MIHALLKSCTNKCTEIFNAEHKRINIFGSISHCQHFRALNNERNQRYIVIWGGIGTEQCHTVYIQVGAHLHLLRWRTVKNVPHRPLNLRYIYPSPNFFGTSTLPKFAEMKYFQNNYRTCTAKHKCTNNFEKCSKEKMSRVPSPRQMTSQKCQLIL